MSRNSPAPRHWWEHRAILKLDRLRDGKREFLGTAFVVTPRFAVTCFHVVSVIEGGGRYRIPDFDGAGDRRRLLRQDEIELSSWHWNETRRIQARMPGYYRTLKVETEQLGDDEVHKIEVEDYILLELAEPISGDRMPLIESLKWPDDFRPWPPEGTEVVTVGYQDNGDLLLGASMGNYGLSDGHLQRPKFIDGQSGVASVKGKSGGPVLVRRTDEGVDARVVCLGMLRLGGTEATKHGYWTTAPLIDLLANAGARNAAEVVPRERVFATRDVSSSRAATKSPGHQSGVFAQGSVIADRGSVLFGNVKVAEGGMLNVNINSPGAFMPDPPTPVPEDPHEILVKHLERVVKFCGELPWGRGGSSGPAEVGSIPPLPPIFVDIQVRAHGQPDIEKTKREGGSTLSALKAAISGDGDRNEGGVPDHMGNRVVVFLGEPGSGKSTVLKYIAYRLARYRLERDPLQLDQLGAAWRKWADGKSVLPILMRCRDFAQWLELRNPPAATGSYQDAAFLRDAVLEILTYGQLQQRSAHEHEHVSPSAMETAFEEWLTNGDVVLLLDGIDEIKSAAMREPVRDAITEFRRRYARCRYLAACRIRSYEDDRNHLLYATTFEMLEYEHTSDRDQVAEFIDKWHAQQKTIEPTSAARIAEAQATLKGAVAETALAELARKPLLLTMMAIVNRAGELPRERARLYARCAKELLWEWGERRQEEQGGTVRLGSRLRVVVKALGMIEEDLESIIAKLAFDVLYDAGRDIATDVLVRAVRGRSRPGVERELGELSGLIQDSGLLQEQAQSGVLAFPHPTLHEYAAAVHLAGRVDFADAVIKRLESDNFVAWWQTLRLAVGHLACGAKNAAEARILFGGQRNQERVELLLSDLLVSPEKESDWRKVWFAGEAIAELGEAARAEGRLGKLTARARAAMVKLVEDSKLTAPQRANAAAALAAIEDPRFFGPTVFCLPGSPDEPNPGLGFIEIEEGQFQMGSAREDRGALDDEMAKEKWERWVEVPRYFIARWPVTIAQYRVFLADPDKRIEARSGFPKFERGIDDLRGVATAPVTDVTWHDAIRYCDWLTVKMRESAKTPAQLRELMTNGDASSNGQPWRVTLPSEAEWEKAARWDGTRSGTYPWSYRDDDEPKTHHLNFWRTGIGHPSPVGCFPLGRSFFCVEEMSGNVWEWTRSVVVFHFHSYIPDIPGIVWETLESKPTRESNPSAGRMLRGGSFSDGPRNVRCVYLHGRGPACREVDLGFRVVVSPSDSGP